MESVLEGSVRRVGNRVRISAQLVDARTDAHLWVEAYDREIEDVFALQEEMARSIVGALGGTTPAFRRYWESCRERGRPPGVNALIGAPFLATGPLSRTRRPGR